MTVGECPAEEHNNIIIISRLCSDAAGTSVAALCCKTCKEISNEGLLLPIFNSAEKLKIACHVF